jgi:hypothetical protein
VATGARPVKACSKAGQPTSTTAQGSPSRHQPPLRRGGRSPCRADRSRSPSRVGADHAGGCRGRSDDDRSVGAFALTRWTNERLRWLRAHLSTKLCLPAALNIASAGGGANVDPSAMRRSPRRGTTPTGRLRMRRGCCCRKNIENRCGVFGYPMGAAMAIAARASFLLDYCPSTGPTVELVVDYDESGGCGYDGLPSAAASPKSEPTAGTAKTKKSSISANPDIGHVKKLGRE